MDSSFKHLEVDHKREPPLRLEYRVWARHPAARCFQAELEELVLRSLQKLKTMASNEVPHEQGVIKGIEIAIEHLDEVRASKEDEE